MDRLKIRNRIYSQTSRILLWVLLFGALGGWLIVLKETDSYYNIYVLCALAAVVSVWKNRSMQKAFSKREAYATVCLSIIFSFCVILSNYRIFKPFSANWGKWIVCLLAGCFVAYQILEAVSSQDIISQYKIMQTKKIYVFGIMFFGSVFLNLVYLFFAAYPGVLTLDSVSQMTQLITNVYSNHHPVFHTWIMKLCISFGYLLFNEINAAVAVFSVCQIVFMGLVFSYVLLTLYEQSVKTAFIIALFFVYSLSPYNIIYSVTLWKDILFGGVMTAMVVSFYRIWSEMPRNGIDYVIYAVASLGICLWRSNGWFVYFLFSLFLCLGHWRARRRLVYIALGVLIFSFILMHPLIDFLKIPQPDIVEALSIPEQQIARVISDGDFIGEENELLLNEICNIEHLAERYDPILSDPVKNTIREGNVETFRKNIWKYLGVWIKIGGKYPISYLEAWIDQTKGYWNGGYSYWIWSIYIMPNDLGIFRTIRSDRVADVFNKWFEKYAESFLWESFRSIGLHIWLTVLAGYCAWKKRNKALMLSVFPSLAVVMSLLLTTPVFAEFRYVYGCILLAPFYLILALSENRKKIFD